MAEEVLIILALPHMRSKEVLVVLAMPYMPGCAGTV